MRRRPILTYKTYAGSLTRNNFNFIAEVNPVNTVTCSFNFSIYNDNFTRLDIWVPKRSRLVDRSGCELEAA